jgi:hypothetical protein
VGSVGEASGDDGEEREQNGDGDATVTGHGVLPL